MECFKKGMRQNRIPFCCSRYTGKNIRYHQNLAERVIAIVVLGNSRWPLVQRHVDRVVAAVDAAKPGTYTEMELPER